MQRGTRHQVNIPPPAGAKDADFFAARDEEETGLRRFQPEFILRQCGADSMTDDPLTHLQYTPRRPWSRGGLARLADPLCVGRVLALGGGGYDRDNLARAWTAVVEGWLV